MGICRNEGIVNRRGDYVNNRLRRAGEKGEDIFCDCGGNRGAAEPKTGEAFENKNFLISILASLGYKG
jgi:hypothetical protein